MRNLYPFPTGHFPTSGARWRVAIRNTWVPLAIVFAVGLIVRMVLIPAGHGQDFVVWEKASAATLHGVNVYQHHPHYPAGPYAYFPLFLFLELPLEWISQNSGMSFTVLGKLPMLAGDIAVAWLIADEVRHRGRPAAVAAIAAALYFLNPVVLDNSALYGRFDTLALALLLLALRWTRNPAKRPWTSCFAFALAVAMKTFPGFVLAGMARSSGRRVLAALALTLTLLSLPYLTHAHAYIRDVLLYNTSKIPQGLSWQGILPRFMDHRDASFIGYGMLLVYAVLLVIFRDVVTSLEEYTLVALLAFLLCSKVVLSHYLTWPMPWLIIAAATGPPRIRRTSAVVLALFTVVALQMNPYFHPFGNYPPMTSYLVAGLAAWQISAICRDARDRRTIQDVA